MELYTEIKTGIFLKSYNEVEVVEVYTQWAYDLG